MVRGVNQYIRPHKAAVAANELSLRFDAIELLIQETLEAAGSSSEVVSAVSEMVPCRSVGLSKKGVKRRRSLALLYDGRSEASL